MNISWWIIWLVIAVVMFVIEAATTGLATLWFGIGAVVAMIMDLCGASVASQIIVMAVISAVCFAVCMIWIRPKLESLRKKNIQHTNADRLIGREGVVIVPLNATEGKGQVKIDGQIWSAKADTDIAEGVRVTVRSIEGVKLVVEITA
ncbi:MAG: NfeD family protein [Saccharofermentans sp.]|nr:NfeD family protein [Clostridiales bacterium]MCR4767101.1 NfeD family protein [Saccharofermentans sp.]